MRPSLPSLRSLLVALTLAASLSFGVPCRALDPGRRITQYGCDSWNYQNGLPGGAVYGVWQLSDGYLWIRQSGGLLRFDGVRFTRLPLEIDGQPVNQEIRSMGRTRDGRLVLRGPTRTFFLAGGRLTEPGTPTERRDGNDRVVFQARDGTLWLGSDSNIYRIREGRLERVADNTGWVSAIYQDRGGRIWIGAGTGLYEYQNERLRLYPSGYNEGVTRTDLPCTVVRTPEHLTTSVTAILEDRDGVLWVGSHDGLHKLVQGELVRDPAAASLTGRQVTALLEDRDGNVWVGSDGLGLFRFTHGRVSRLGEEDGLGDNGVCCLCEDDEGSLWIGTRSGLDRLRDTPLVTLSAREGLSHNVATTVTEGPDGTLYVFTYGGGITLIKGGQFDYLNHARGLPSDFAAAMYVDRNGTLWTGSADGLKSYRDGTFTAHPDGGVLQQSFISCIAEDDEGIILATSQLKLFRYRNGAYEPYEVGVPPGEGASHARYVYAMHHDDDGTLWIAMTAGVWKVPRGVRPEKAELTSFIRPAHTLYDDGRGFLWITGPDTEGFSRLRKSDGQLVTYGTGAGIPSGPMGRVITDRQGNLWIGTGSGILRVPREQADLYAEGGVAAVETRMFDVRDGMRTEECTESDRQPTAWRAHDGRMYFATPKGLVVVDPDSIVRNRRVPPVVIEELVVDRKVCPRPEGLRIAPGSDAIEIHYTALSYRIPSRVRFRYQLVGYNSDWVDAGDRRTAYFTQLSPGSYRFRVAASNDDGVWNDTGASIAFTLRPHFYQMLWFYLACTAAAAGCAVGLHRIRVRRLRRHEAELVQLVEDRTRSLREEVSEHAAARRELQKYRDYLEQLVAERTGELQTSNQQLQREIAERRLSEERYRRFFEEDLAAAFIATPSGRLVAHNPSFARMFDLSAGAETEPAELGSFFTDPAKPEELVQRLRGHQSIQDEEFEMKSRRGRTLTVLANVVGSYSESGELLEIKGYAIDHTERKRLETQLRQSQKMEAIGQLAGGVAHDFNNLLTAIIGSSDCIVLDPTASEESKKLAGEVRAAGERAAALTRQLLAFSRKQVLQPKVINLNDVLAEMTGMLRRLIGEDIRLKLSPGPRVRNIRADPHQIQQVVLNLSVNARDAMPRGGVLAISTGDVHLTAPEVQNNLSVPPGDYVCLTVADSGSGMSPEVLQHLFEPFFTTKGVGKGTGLGLSTVYGVVQQTNGYILVATEVGRGTTFRVYLPVVPEAVAADARPVTLAPFPREGKRVLLVEDNELVLAVAQRCLRQFGFEVVEATNGMDALAKCRRDDASFDLMITDVVMPVMNGRELAERVRREFPSIKVLFMSGYLRDAKDQIGDLDQVAFLEKPFTPDALLRQIHRLLGENGATEEGGPGLPATGLPVQTASRGNGRPR